MASKDRFISEIYSEFVPPIKRMLDRRLNLNDVDNTDIFNSELKMK